MSNDVHEFYLAQNCAPAMRPPEPILVRVKRAAIEKAGGAFTDDIARAFARVQPVIARAAERKLPLLGAIVSPLTIEAEDIR